MASKKESANAKAPETCLEKRSQKHCPMLTTIKDYLENRLDELEDLIQIEINPLHRVELESYAKECYSILKHIKSLTESPDVKLYNAIFNNKLD